MTPAEGAALVDAVAARYRATDPGEWPDPHPDGVVPQEHYSRVTDGARYVVVRQRLGAWFDELATRGAVVDEVPSPDLDRSVERTLRARAPGGGAPLYAHHLAPAGGVVGGVLLCFGDPRVVVADVPHCGCDACDDGSERLLEEVDDVVASAVAGLLSVEVTRRHHHVELRSSSSTGGHGGSRPAVLGAWRATPWF